MTKQKLWELIEAYRTSGCSEEHHARKERLDAVLDELLAQPAPQEWPKPKFVRNVDGVPCITLVEHEYLMRSRTSPPASKPWVGLTQEERDHIWNTVGNSDAHGDVDGYSGRDVMAAIEAKLREKNT